MVGEIVRQVLADNSHRRVTVDPKVIDKSLPPVLEKARAAEQKATAASSAGSTAAAAKPKRKIIREGSVCPLCGQGKVLKGHTAYGCSRWKEGCTFRKPFRK